VAVEPGLQFLAADLLEMLVVNVETAVHLQVSDAQVALNRHADVILTTSADSPAEPGYQQQLWRSLTLQAVGPVGKAAQAEGRLDWAGKLPQLSKAPLAFCCSDPRLLRQWLLRSNGTAFLPTPLCQELCQSGLYQLLAMPEQQLQVRLWIAKDAPVMWQPPE
jgi:DNA-binding transcriptional LysR family regulator